MKKEQRNAIEAILDTEDNSSIILFDEKDNEIEFEQIAVIPGKKCVYTVLKPVVLMEGVKDDEALVFILEEDANGEDTISVVTDEKIIEKVFKDYYKLLDEDEGK